MDDLDFDVVRFSKLLSKLPVHTPIADAFERTYPQERDRWWSSQREHMVSWFRSQGTTGSGAYRREEANRSARRTYNRLQCPGALIWIAEALGADSNRVERAATEALSITDRRSRCKAIREHLPWELIAELAEPRIKRPIKAWFRS